MTIAEFQINNGSICVERRFVDWAEAVAQAGHATPILVRAIGRFRFIDREWTGLYVYFARGRKTGTIKIGLSKDPEKRMSQLRGRGEGFELLACISRCDLIHEDRFCHLLEEYRLPGGKEWFMDCPATRILTWFLLDWRERDRNYKWFKEAA